MITIRQKRPGKGQPWSIFIHVDGIIRQKTIGDKKQAEQVAKELRAKMIAGQFRLDGHDTKTEAVPEFSAFFGRFMKEHAEVRLKWTTYTGYKALFDRHLSVRWSGKRLDEIQRRDIRELITAKQAEGLAPGTVRNILSLLSAILEYARDLEILRENPAQKLSKFIGRKTDRLKNVNCASPEEISAILSTAEADFPAYAVSDNKLVQDRGSAGRASRIGLGRRQLRRRHHRGLPLLLAWPLEHAQVPQVPQGGNPHAIGVGTQESPRFDDKTLGWRAGIPKRGGGSSAGSTSICSL